MTEELNALSKMQLETLGKFMPIINKQEAEAHSGMHLPQLQLKEGGYAYGNQTETTTGTEFRLEEQGHNNEIYRRDFEERKQTKASSRT